MKNIIVLLFLTVQVSFANEIVWAKTGHRTVGEVAQNQLTRKAKKAIKELLDGHDLAFVSNYADEIKADKAFNEYFSWHYVNFPPNTKYKDIPPSPEGDLIVAVETSVKALKDKNTSKEDKAFYLKLLVHFMGDLHQPMHAGQGEDKGGNDIQVRWFGEGTNLHRVWDSDMINSYAMSYTELANALPKLGKNEMKRIVAGSIYEWIEESQDLANEIYTSVEVGEKLGYNYSYKYMNTVRNQLLKGGLRLAKVLNDIFA